jgi:ribosomal protein S18 acetylase RimI-like enzyme
MKIEHTNSPKAEDIEYLTNKINEETKEEYSSAFPFAFFIRNKDEQIIAGCNGYIIFGCVYTDQLWVDSNYRHQGYAKNLMEKVHEHGRKQGCSMATICTMSFQNAVNLYKKLEYKVDFERQGYAKDASCLFLRKDL